MDIYIIFVLNNITIYITKCVFIFVIIAIIINYIIIKIKFIYLFIPNMSDKGKAKKGKKDEKKNEEPKEKVEKKEEGAQEEGEAKPTQNLGPQDLQQGEELFGVCHICATFNDTFIHVTDLSGRETYARVTGGMKVKADREESSPYAAMLAAQDVYARLKQLGVTAIHIKMRGKGGSNTRALGPGAQTALRALARLGLKIGRIEDVTPIPTDSTRRAGGRRGRRL